MVRAVNSRRSAAAAVAAALMVAACSSSSDGDANSDAPESSTATTSDTTEPAAPSDPVVDPPPTSPADTTLTTEPVVTEPDTDPAPGPDPSEPAWMSGSEQVLFDQAALHTFEINVADEDLAFLDADPAAEEYVEGSFSFNGETIDPVGVRYKGSVGSFVGCTSGANPFDASGPKTCRKLSMKLKINWDDPDREFYGVRKVQLHSQNLDPTKMHERLGYWLFREAGVPAPRSTHARVVLNGDYLGLFALTEQIDGRFTRANFENGKGNLYKESWPIDATGEVRSEDELRDSLKTNEDDDPPVAPIQDFATAVLESGADALDEWTDRDQLLRTFVVDRLIANDDGALHWYCLPDCEPHNFFWYEEQIDNAPGARLHLVPWDLDNAFSNLDDASFVAGITKIADPWGETTNDCESFPFGAAGLLQLSAACDPIIAAAATFDDDYDRIRAELIGGAYSEATVNEMLDTWAAQIESAVMESDAAFDDAATVEQWRLEIQRLKDAIAGERAR